MTPEEELAWVLRTHNKRHGSYHRLQRYYDGDHDLTFATEKYKNAFGVLFRAFALNLCKGPVTALEDRLELETFTGALADDANHIWRANRMDVSASEVHTESFYRGDSYVIVWPDATGAPRIWPQDASQMVVQYADPDDPGLVTLAGKVWAEEAVKEGGQRFYRATVYTGDVLRKYRTRNPVGERPDKVGQFVPFVPPDESTEGGPEVDNPYGRVPVFHFASGVGYGKYGVSVIHDVIPIQNWLNKSVSDLLVAMETVALPQRYAIGVEVEEDPNNPGRAKPGYMERAFPTTPGSTWTLDNPEATFGQFQGADLSGFLEVVREAKLTVAQITGTPAYYLVPSSGEAPSGESLKTQDGRLVKNAKRYQRRYGPRWAEVMAFGVAISQNTAVPVDHDLEAVWESAATRDEVAEAATIEAKIRIGISKEQGLRELGYTEEEIEQMNEEKSVASEAFARSALVSFDRSAPVSTAAGGAMAEAEVGTNG